MKFETESSRELIPFFRAELLDEDDVNRIYALISDESAAIRFAAGEFIFQHLLSKTGADPSNPDHDAQLRAMLDFIEEKTQHAELPNYVVDALWGKATVLKDWAAMTNLLLTESQKKALSDSQQTLLVRILNCSVKKACGEKIVPKTKADPDHKDKKEAIQESKSKLSEHLVKALPQVLQKFKADKEKTADLVEIPQYFDLGVYSTFRLTTQHKELLKLLQEIFNKSVDAYTFRNIAKTLAYLQTENENARQTDVAINELSDAAFAKFRSALDNAESEESEEELALTLALQRLAELTKYLGLAHLDELFDSIENALQGNLAAQGEECVMRALDILFYQLAWARSKIDPNRPDTDAIDALVRKRDAVFKLLEKYLKNKSVAIAEKAFLVANDMLIMFSKSMRDAKTSLSALGYLPSTALVTQMRGFFADEVTNKQTFRDDEDEMARKEKLITALAKSIAFNALHADNAPAVLCNFVSHGKFVEEIVKTFLHKLREKYKDNEYRVILETLKIKYEQVESSITEGEAVTVPTSPQKKKKSKSKKTDDEEDQEKDKEEGDDLEEDDEDTASRTPLRALERLSKRLADTYGIPTQRHEWLR
jgi:cohesin complex subunit SA-1/2